MSVEIGSLVLLNLLSKLDGMEQFELISMSLLKLRLELLQEVFGFRNVTILDEIDP